MSNNVLNVPISEKTRRKLGALAILTGKKFDSIEAEIAELLDTVLSQKIDAAMAMIDGRELSESRFQVAVAETSEVEESETEEDAEETSLVDDIAGHSLSADEDPGTRSLEEEYEEEERKMKQKKAAPATRQVLPAQLQTDDIQPPEIEAEDVGSNAEAFLDEALKPAPKARNQAQSSINRYGSRASNTTGSFNPQRRKAAVSEYTGDESDSENIF